MDLAKWCIRECASENLSKGKQKRRFAVCFLTKILLDICMIQWIWMDLNFSTTYWEKWFHFCSVWLQKTYKYIDRRHTTENIVCKTACFQRGTNCNNFSNIFSLVQSWEMTWLGLKKTLLGCMQTIFPSQTVFVTSLWSKNTRKLHSGFLIDISSQKKTSFPSLHSLLLVYYYEVPSAWHKQKSSSMEFNLLTHLQKRNSWPIYSSINFSWLPFITINTPCQLKI